VYVTEQVPEKLGSTVSVVREATEASRCATSYAGKTKFSMHADDASKMKGMLDECDHVCVMGIEAHVCVLQTVLDLLEAGKSVHVCVDATSSIRLEDRAVALRRMENAGAVLTCTESVIFEMLGDASDEAFRDVSKIVREGAKNKPASPPLPSL
jgi:nicotinamidase-related amidase